MNERTKTGLKILEAALLLGILGDVLLRETPWGLNVFLWVGALVAAMLMLARPNQSKFLSRQTIALHSALVFFAAMFVLRDSIELKILNALAILTILSLLVLPALKIKMSTAGIIHYAFAGIWSGINAAFAPFYLLFGDIKWKTLPQKGWTKHLIAVLRGVAIAAPILFVFGALFMAADAVFQGIIEETLRINPEIIFTHLLLTAFISWMVAGYLRGSLIETFTPETKDETKTEMKSQLLSVTVIKEDENGSKENENQSKVSNKPEEKAWDWRNFDNSLMPRAFTLGAIEISIVLGLINLLFLAFVIVQLPYLFGGMDLVQNTPDFKLAEYARRGFGELVAVAALVLPILLVSHWLMRKDSPMNEKIYRVLAGIQIVLLFVIMISATQRLLLLTGNLGYGLTTVRLYPMVFMIWLALVFLWFTLTVLRGAREQFAWGALWSAFFVLGTLHVLSPDDFIVRTNVRLMQQGRMFDSNYVVNLSDDAVPALLENLPAMSFEQQCHVKYRIAHRFEKSQAETDFRTWNWSRYAARNAMARHGESLNTSNCPGNTRSDKFPYEY
jgi:hypothetical protein